MNRPRSLAILAVTTLLVALAAPVLGAKPSAPPGQANKAEKTAITITGTVQESTDSDGRAVFTLDDDGKTYTLDGGPVWFYGNDHPLEKYVGQAVTIVGVVAAGSTDVDVETVNGVALREGGKPPWAGGWKAVGERHPGWSQEKADRFEARSGGCWPPGHCKQDAAPESSD